MVSNTLQLARQYYLGSLAVSVAAIIAGYLIGGVPTAVSVAILAVIETSLSIDNAVVNASVLRHWDTKWQQRFLVWGMPIAVFLPRFILPMLIVAVSTDRTLIETFHLATDQPDIYSSSLKAAHHEIAAFGGTFLMIVALKFFVDEEKDVHWFSWVEHSLAKLGTHLTHWTTLGLIVMLGATVWAQYLPDEERVSAMIAAAVGVVTYGAIDMLKHMVGGDDVGTKIVKQGVVGILYLEVLDASFSLDGVVAALAISTQVWVILLGLGAGAMFVRSVTIHLVRAGTLNKFRYLEHSAFMAIGFLALTMFAGTMIHIHEAIIGVVSAAMIALGIWTSVRHHRMHPEDDEVMG